MREILFKAKRKDNGEWVEGNLVTGIFFKLGQPIPYILSVENVDYDCFEDLTDDYGYYEVVPETLCQYTGLTDKNKNKIWENDVVILDDELYMVEWYETFLQWELRTIVPSVALSLGEIYPCEMEVIGNRFDNPEFWNSRKIEVEA